ncbi:MAG: inositol monophosphatase family protein [Streptosporangiaceae bacterium]
MDVDNELLTAALEIAGSASRLTARRFLEGTPVRIKADGTEVTPADVEAEELVRSLIAARFPGDGVFGEELAETPGTTGRRWVIDPINGTTAFARRIPMFNILLAVEDGEGGAVSVISYPMSQEVYYAGRGRGAWHRAGDGPPQRITVTGTRRRRGAAVEAINPATWSEDLLMTLHREVWLLPQMKASSGVASGLTDAMIIAGLTMGYEDLAPMPLLVAEAGGHVTDLKGNDVLSGDGTALASNGQLHEALLDLVRDLPSGRDYQALRA